MRLDLSLEGRRKLGEVCFLIAVYFVNYKATKTRANRGKQGWAWPAFQVQSIVPSTL